MKCPGCGEDLEAGARFCPICGHSFGGAEEAPAAGSRGAAEVEVEAPAGTLTLGFTPCPVCRFNLTERAPYCPKCRCKLAYCTTPDCGFVGVAGKPACPNDFAPLQTLGAAWRQRFSDSGNTCSTPEATGLTTRAEASLEITPPVGTAEPLRCAGVTCDGGAFYTTEYGGRLLHVGFDRQYREPIAVRGGAPQHLGAAVMGETAWVAVADGAMVCCIVLPDREVIETDLEGGQVVAGLVHNGRWMAAAGQDAEGRGAVWVWSRPEPLTWTFPEPVSLLPAWSGDRLMVAAGDRLWCLAASPEGLAVVWEQALGGPVSGHVTVTPGARPVVATVAATGGGLALALWEAEGGRRVWETAPPTTGLPTEGASTDGERLFLAVEDQILVHERRTGNLVARWDTGAPVWSPVTVTADVVLVGAGQRVLAIDKTTDRETSLMIPLAQLIPETPVVFSDNWVAVSDQGGIWAWQSGL